MSVEQQIEKLNQEIKDVKSSFEQSATMMKIYSTKITFSTSMNTIIFSNPSYNPLEWETLVSLPRIDANTRCGVEPIIVTFNCEKGINTFATLEIKVIEGGTGLRTITTKRLPYSGGSRWLVTTSPYTKMNSSGWYNWYPTVIEFNIKSATPGQLEAKMIWQ